MRALLHGAAAIGNSRGREQRDQHGLFAIGRENPTGHPPPNLVVAEFHASVGQNRFDVAARDDLLEESGPVVGGR